LRNRYRGLGVEDDGSRFARISIGALADTVTHLREMMLEELERRNYSTGTIRYQVRFVERFAEHFGKSPDKLGPEHVRSYQSHLLKQLRLRPGSVEHHISALRFFYVQTLHRYEFRQFLPF
jgi:integrase/recombinase XerD